MAAFRQKFDDLREWSEDVEPRDWESSRTKSRRYTGAAAVMVGVLTIGYFGYSGSDEDVTPDHAAQFGADGGSPRFLEPPPPTALERSDVFAPDAADEPATDAAPPASPVKMGPPLAPPSHAGIPSTVLRAYNSAADDLRQEDPGCSMSVPLLAAIGKVESSHAYGGRVDSTGRALTPIIGIPLDGRPGVALIRDSDGGRYDGDTAFDRAVGPMQFIPTSWARWAADGNRDGIKDPQNTFDASLAAGRYLCAAGGDVTTDSGLRRAVMAYNHSERYLQTVLSWMRVYAGGTMAVPDGQSVGIGGALLTSGASEASSPNSSGKPVDTPSASSDKSSSSSDTTSSKTSSSGGTSSSGSSGSSGGGDSGGSTPPKSPPPSTPPPSNGGGGNEEPDEEPADEPDEDPDEPDEDPPPEDPDEEPDDDEPIVRLNPNPPGTP